MSKYFSCAVNSLKQAKIRLQQLRLVPEHSPPGNNTVQHTENKKGWEGEGAKRKHILLKKTKFKRYEFIIKKNLSKGGTETHRLMQVV